jgi:hypothetical protein
MGDPASTAIEKHPTWPPGHWGTARSGVLREIFIPEFISCPTSFLPCLIRSNESITLSQQLNWLDG